MNEKKEETKAPEVVETPASPKKRGFAAMDPALVSQISSKGGKAAHAQGKAHQFTTEQARAAGRKGGTAPHVNRGGSRKKKEDSA